MVEVLDYIVLPCYSCISWMHLVEFNQLGKFAALYSHDRLPKKCSLGAT